jgi:hypothetical protein
MPRIAAALIALTIATLILLSALAAPAPQQDCSAGPCTYLPIVQVPLPSPTPDTTVRVVSSRSYVRDDDRYVVGEVLNSRSAAVYLVKISARFYDAADALVAVEDANTIQTMTEPGQKNPFKIVLGKAPATIVRYELSLSWSDVSLVAYRPATILSQQKRDNSGPEVFGELRNDQASTLFAIQVAVTFYDAAGQVVDTDLGFPSTTILAPGSKSDYKVSTFDGHLTFITYAVQAQGYLEAQ